MLKRLRQALKKKVRVSKKDLNLKLKVKTKEVE